MTPMSDLLLNLVLEAIQLAEDEHVDPAGMPGVLERASRLLRCDLVWQGDAPWTPLEETAERPGPERIGAWLVRLNPDRAPLNELERRTLRSLSHLVARFLSRPSRLDSEILLRQRSEVFFKVARVLEAGLSLNEILQEAVDVVWQVLRPGCVEIFLDTEQMVLERVASLDFTGSQPGPDWLPWLRDRMLEELPRYLPADEDVLATPAGIGRAIVVPLARTGQPRGVLVLREERATRVWSTEDEELVLGIAELLAIAIENQTLVDDETAARSAAIVASELASEREALIRQIVHDLRNATQAISLANEELERHAEAHPELSRHVTSIDRQVQFISSFLKEKLAWIRQSRENPSERGCDPDLVLENLHRRYAARFAARGSRYVWSPATEPTRLTVQDRELESMLSHLLDNALQHTEPGTGVQVSAAISDGWATFYVIDDGPGLPDDLRTLANRERGGLASIRRMATLRGGLFGHAPHEPRGNSFHLTLPTTTWGKS